MKRILYLILGLILSVSFISCDDDDPVIPNGEELITTVTFTMTPESGGDMVTLTFVDLDGDGGENPVITGGILAANTSYLGTIELLNETASPVENITLEVIEEANDHQFFFQSTVGGVTIEYLDEDDNGNPLGVNTRLTTGDAGSGMLTIILEHEGNKFGENVAKGDNTNSGGATDVDADFPIDVQ